MKESIEFGHDSVRCVFCGEITSQEVMDANNNVINHEHFKSFRSQLWIFKSVKKFTMSTEEIKLLAEKDRAASNKNPHMKVAVVTDSSLAFGLSRMYETFYGKGPWDTMVFYNLDEAVEWINM